MDIEKNLKMYFEQQINTLPDNIDFRNNQIENFKTPKSNHIPRKLVMIMVLLVSMTGTSIVYGDSIVTYIKHMNFFHSNGGVAWSIDTEKEDRSYENIVDTTFDQLQLAPGQGVAIYAVDDNPNKIIVSRQEPLVIQDINKLNSYQINSLDYAFASELLQNYEFHEGRVTFDTRIPNNYTDLILDEAKTTGKSVIVKMLEPSTDVLSLVVEYYSKEHLEESPVFTVQIMKWIGDKVIEVGDEEGMPTNNYEKLMLGESEVLFSELSGQKEILWINSGFYYKISSIQEAMTKDELLNITKALALK